MGFFITAASAFSTQTLSTHPSPASHAVFLSQSQITTPTPFSPLPSSLCTFHFRGNGHFPRVIIPHQACSTATLSTIACLTLFPPLPIPLPTSHLPHCCHFTLSPKAAAQPHLAVPEWAASALALPGPSGALDSCVCVFVSTGPAPSGHSQPFKPC